MQNTESLTKSPAYNMPRKLLFIVNPNAGKKISNAIIKIIRKEFPQNMYYQIVIWKNKDHFDEISSLLKSEGYTDAIAVGGDGTVNKVASEIKGTTIRLGIVPIGSGNGLARSLGLSMDIEEVIKQIVEGKHAVIDSGLVNGDSFFCTSGIGFDAHIALLFAQSKSRGLQAYVKITVAQLLKYRAKTYTLKLNGQTFNRKAFLITVANAGQYGNDFYIAPQAKLDDGLFHVVILKPFNVFQLPGIFINILLKKANKSRSVETYTTNSVIISRDDKDSLHYDGEPNLAGKELVYEIEKNALRVIVGPKYN